MSNVEALKSAAARAGAGKHFFRSIVLVCQLAPLCIGLAACSANARFDMWEIRGDQPGSALGQLGARPNEGMKNQQLAAPLGQASTGSGPGTSQSYGYASVIDGDTLETIAAKYHVSVESLVAANGLTTRMLTPGQYLLLPAPAQDASVTRVK